MVKKKKENMGFHHVINVFMILSIVFGFVFYIFYNSQLSGLVIFNQNNETDFSQGTYTNTYWSGSSIKTIPGNLDGIYLSKVFDAGNDVVWNYISSTSSKPKENTIIVIDNDAKVWKSDNFGTNWKKLNDDYNGIKTNGVTSLTVSGNGELVLLYNQGIWHSSNGGMNWTELNNDFNGAETPNGVVMASDSSYLYIIEDNEYVYRSSDYGASWSLINNTDFNNENINVVGLDIADGKLFAVDGNSDVWQSSDNGVTWLLIKDDYNGGESNNILAFSIDGNNDFYAVENDDDVWQSTDLGLSWVKVNDDYNGESQHLKVLGTDISDYLYIIEADEDVWQSIDEGANWNKVNGSDFNNGGSDVSAFVNFPVNSNLSIYAKVCNQSNCADGNWIYVPANNNFSLSGRYFQYLLLFKSNSADASHDVYNIAVNHADDTTAPFVSLVFPLNNTGDYDGELTYSFNVTDTNSIANCSLIKDGASVQTDTTITKSVTQTFTSSGLTGKHSWKVGCYDLMANYGESNLRYFSVVKLSKFSSSLNFSNIDLGNVVGLSIEENSGKVAFLDNIDLSNGIDLDANINISKNRIEVKSALLNKSATLTLNGLNFTNPKILIDGQICGDDICKIISYNGGILKFNVTHFTVYSAQDGDSSQTSTGASSGGVSGGGPTTPAEETLQTVASESSPSSETTTSAENTGEVTDNPLFDIKIAIDDNSKQVSGSDSLLATVSLFNFGNNGKTSVDIYYEIKNENGTYYNETEIVEVEAQNEFVKEFELNNLDKGNYKLSADLTYSSGTAHAEDSFEVVKTSMVWYLKVLILTLSLLIAGSIAYFLMYFKKPKEDTNL